MRLNETARTLADRHPILGLLALNGLAGALAGVLVVTGLVVLDVGGIGSLMAASEMPALPFALMTVGFVITLSSVAMGAAVMRIGRDEIERPSGGQMIPIRVRSDRRLR